MPARPDRALSANPPAPAGRLAIQARVINGAHWRGRIMGKPQGMDSLEPYRRKRNPGRTPEPMPGVPADPDAQADSVAPAGRDAADTPGTAGTTDAVGPPDTAGTLGIAGTPGTAGTTDATGAPAAAAGGQEPGGVFVVQEHHARRLHWDFRLERDGVLVSWAVPKGVPDDPTVNHFAAQTEDHPMEYASFAGRIPAGEYGAGTVTIWDRGTFDTVKWTDREVKVVLHGRRLTGGYTLFQTRGKDWMIHRERQPLPGILQPMLARSEPHLPPDSEPWALEMKWDGVRALAYCEGGRVRLISRTGEDITAAYPELRGLATAVGRRDALLDGEVVAMGDSGWPDFEVLQNRMHVRDASLAQRLVAEYPVTYLAFDLLHLDGRPLLSLPYTQRRELLESLALNGPWWQTPPSFIGEPGADVQKVSLQHGLEGVVAKRLDSRYDPGKRPGTWRKVKNILRQEVVIGGWRPGKGNRSGQIGSLLVGVQEDGGLVYAGHVGTGFTDRVLRQLTAQLAPLRRATSPFAAPLPADHARDAVWAEPVLVADVRFTGWTRAGRMRAPSYQGLRSDKAPAEVIREP
jgi:bifunctional non-homologous end joining protein LigD